MEDSKGKKLNTLESFANQVENSHFNEDSLLSLTKNLKSLFNCEEATLFALDAGKRELYTKNFQKEGFPEIRLNISVKNIAGFVAATGKPLNIKNVKDHQELAQFHHQLTYDSSWDKNLNKDTTSMIAVPLPYKKKLVGVMEIINKEGGLAFDQEDLFKAKAISPIMGMAIAKLSDGESDSSNGNSTAQGHQLHILSQMIHSSENFEDLLKRLKQPLLQYFDVEAITIYGVDETRREIYSKVTYGNKLGKIRVPISPNSVAGYVAMIKKTVNIPDTKDLGKIKTLHPKMAFDDSWEKMAGVSTKSLLTLPLLHGSQLQGVLQLVNKKDMNPFSAQDERNGFPIAQALALALYNHKKNESFVSENEEKIRAELSGSSGRILPQGSEASQASSENQSKKGGASTANILVQNEDDETTILVRILKDGSRLVYQQIDPPRDVIKLIKEVANIDLDLPPNPHRRKDDHSVP
ncbi:MAG: GAF domain-containing protein [Nitrospina sp.]|nr:GAF domain-containing protein [Nitrospina sp.]